MIHRPHAPRRSLLAFVLALVPAAAAPADEPIDPFRQLQEENIDTRSKRMDRPYHFGSQGAGDVFSNHASHSNRLIPVYVFGKKADLGSVTGANSRYRDPEEVRPLFGTIPENTVNPEAEYADQSDLYKVQADAVAKGAKRLFIVWFDGMDWQTTQASAIAATGKVYTQGKGTGLNFLDYGADGSAQYGFVVTSPTHDKNDADVDSQTVTIPRESLGGGYDAEVAGPNPWTPGPKAAAGYLKGQGASDADKSSVAAVGRVLHAYTDSSQSAGEVATGVKSYNNGVNVSDDGRFVPTLFNRLQGEGWKVGTVTSVPFDHVSPAAMYAHNVHRDDYQDLARDMLGIPGIVQETDRDQAHPGLDVVMGAGSGQDAPEKGLKGGQGQNAKGGNIHITDADKAAIDVANGGKYVVVQPTPGVDGGKAIMAAAERAAEGGHRLFGFFGTNANHLPYRTADGRYNPGRGLKGIAETYAPSDLEQNPTLAEMTEAALTVLATDPDRPFALFVEAGDVDFALHDNNLDNAIGAVHGGALAVQVIIDWVEAHGGWDDSVLIVSADHGHYLVIDDLEALAEAARGTRRDDGGAK